MLYFKKSQPAPECLEREKTKASGDYKCGCVLARTRDDFKNKCYLCEYKEPESINLEHFVAHRGDLDLKFDWNNLFWACAHCNSTKHDRFGEILDCTNPKHDVESKLKCAFSPFPFEMPQIESLHDDERTHSTR